MATVTYPVTGMTCEHCVRAVRGEVGGIGGVSAVRVDLVAGGTSQVTVTSAAPVPPEEIVAALDEAGGYQLAGA